MSASKTHFSLMPGLLTWLAVAYSGYISVSPMWMKLFIAGVVAFGLAMVLDAYQRLSAPSTALTLGLSAAACVWSDGFGLTPALYAIYAASLYGRIPSRYYYLALCLLNVVLLAALRRGAEWPWVMSAFIAYGGFQLFGVMLSRGAQELARSNAALSARHAELLATRALLDESVRAEERLRLSRELHDVAGHKLTALKLTLRTPPETSLSADKVALCAALADELLGDIRAVVAQLRHHDGVDLQQALQELKARWPDPPLTLELTPGLRASNLAQAETLLRVAQEGLTNVSRHAQAKHVRMALRQDADELELSVCDDGQARWPLREGNGLLGMRERLQALGGSLQLEPVSPHGLCIRARVPLANKQTKEQAA